MESATSKKYRDQNRDALNAKSKAWHSANKLRVSLRHAAWARQNSHLTAARTRKRDAAKLNATPSWADMDSIKAIYAQAARMTAATGTRHEVDHIFPLQGIMVCGLHVAANLQIITKRENIAKGNKMPAAVTQQNSGA